MKYLLFISIIVSLLSCKSQRLNTLQSNFSFGKPKLSEIDSIEHRNGGTRIYKSYKIGVAGDYFPNADKFNLGQPLLYIRDTSTHRTNISYFFSHPDSSIRLIEYSWDASRGKHNDLKRLYKANVNTINQVLGKTGYETTENHDTWSQKTIVWDTDSLHIKQFILFEGRPTRTRVLISWQ